jgi:hypothetical protein
LLLASTAKAQNHFYLPEPTSAEADSMILELTERPSNDTMRLLLYMDLGFYYLEYKKDSCIYYFEKQVAFFATKPTNRRTGMGLSFTNDIVKVHGGELSVDSILELATSCD